MKKLSTCLLILALLLGSVQTPGYAATIGSPDFEVQAENVYLYNLDTDTLIYERNADQAVPPASLSYIMTCILALESTGDLDAEILTYPGYVQDYLYDYQYIQGKGAVATGGLMAGEQLPMRELLYAMMLPSATEASMIIAHHLGGSQEGFAEMMNQKAKEIGATKTNFVNPNGLHDPAQVTTAQDMALIAAYAYNLPGFMDIVEATGHTYGPTNLHDSLTWNTTNLMMVDNNSYYYGSLRGIKASAMDESGRSFVSTATRDGFTYLLVVMKAPYRDAENNRLSNNTAFEDTKAFYDWVFSTYRRKDLVGKGKYVVEVPLRLSMEKDFLQLMTADRFSALVPSNVDAASVNMIFNIPDAVNAPVEKSQKIGTVTLMLAGEVIGEVELLAAETVEASVVLVVLERIKLFMRTFWFKFVAVFLLLVVVAYVVLMILRNRRRYRGYKPRRRL